MNCSDQERDEIQARLNGIYSAMDELQLSLDTYHSLTRASSEDPSNTQSNEPTIEDLKKVRKINQIVQDMPKLLKEVQHMLSGM